jgi:hypothetical protein
MSDRDSNRTPANAKSRDSRRAWGWLLAVLAVYCAWLLWLAYVGWNHSTK